MLERVPRVLHRSRVLLNRALTLRWRSDSAVGSAHRYAKQVRWALCANEVCYRNTVAAATLSNVRRHPSVQSDDMRLCYNRQPTTVQCSEHTYAMPIQHAAKHRLASRMLTGTPTCSVPGFRVGGTNATHTVIATYACTGQSSRHAIQPLQRRGTAWVPHGAMRRFLFGRLALIAQLCRTAPQHTTPHYACVR
jgi:hypothetical protein